MHKCNGKWDLIPDLSFYEQGEPPQSCLYEISVDGLNVGFKLSWVQTDGSEVVIEFSGQADSIPKSVATPKGAEASYTKVSDSILESRMFIADVEMAYAKRAVSNDGNLMSVLQVNTMPSGEKTRITQVYKRVKP
ncbi:hypothetical protein [Vibrio parahaemolyticus]|uniref:hypothetical protein n=1 Tax=Vibrio parahaemolyticus TaxID=670 RepID=UPI00111DC363|nr:hypothetical protein [Vibrio parahaemolyticus]TOF62043.1 hypothetical protein CGJ17_23210 [Vibrio parahaemolyticus]TOF71603.1 hypothetical protein CGJ18_22220 [Vibrio parahaemolyticus]HCG6160232.1 hypothetical protein [Vibrio parahaemolyticus]